MVMINSTTSSNITKSDWQKYDLIDLWYYLSLGGALFGVVGNIVFAYIVRKFPNIWKHANYRILFGVILADTLTNLVCVPFETTQTYLLLKYNIVLGTNDWCMLEAGLFIEALSLSNYGQTLLSIYKFFAVFFPLFYRHYLTPNRMVIILYISLVIVPVIVFFYGGLGWLIWYDMDPKVGDCREKSLVPEIDTLRSSLFQYFPIVLSLLIYISIMFRILTLKGNQEAKQKTIKRASGSMALCICMVIYAICVSLYWFEYASESYGVAIGSNIWKKYAMRLTFGINPAYHSEFTEFNASICSMALLPLKTKFRGPAPTQMDQNAQDIIDESIYLFKSLVFFKNFEIQSDADRVLMYLVLYIIECLKLLQKCSNRLQGEKELNSLGIANFSMPGDPGFPQELSNFYLKPKDINEREKLKAYMQQLRQEMSSRIIEKIFPGSASEPPSKWWMCFSKKKFLDKALSNPGRF